MVSVACSWLTTHADLLPAGGDALDVACGRGRNALWLAERGLRTRAVDRDADAVRALNEQAGRRGLPLRAEVLDLENGSGGLGSQSADVIVVVRYLHRPLFPALIDALRPGGVLVYETFTRAQAARGKPTNPAFLLEPGELLQLVRPLEVLAYREGEYDAAPTSAMVASVIGRCARA